MARGRDSQNGQLLDVATWNIHGGRGLGNRYKFTPVIELIAQRDPDVIGLQEVDREYHERSNFDDQVELLASELDMQARFGGNLLREEAARLDDEPGAYGIAVLCDPDYPIEASAHHLLPSTDRDGESAEQRGLLETQLRVGDQRLFFYNTHLSLVESLRTRQVALIQEIAARRPNPQILVGDFNAEPDSPPIAQVTKRYDDVAVRAGDPEQSTRPPGEAAGHIDYIFVTPEIEVHDYTVVDDVASDHLMVETTLAIGASA